MKKLLAKCMAALGLLPLVAMTQGEDLAVPELESTANQELVDFHKKIYEPKRLEKIGNRVYMSIGHSYANFSFIEGDDGVVLVDAGFYTGNAEKALALFRETVSDKPIVGMIYTHSHGDHRGGSSVFARDAGNEIPVWAPGGWNEDGAYMESSLRQMVFYKALSQFGALLPVGVDGSVGSGIGPVTRVEGSLDFVRPNREVHDITRITLGGVKMELIPMYGDIKGHMWVWLPEEKVMFTGDTIMGATMPYIDTVRFEPDRRALEFVKSLDHLFEYPVEYVVPGHGRPLMGSDDVREIAVLNRDFAQLLANQVTRFILKGYSADEAIDRFQLPPQMASHPDMQPHYHRLPWLIRGLYAKRTGWADDPHKLIRHTESQEAKRLLPLLGGEQGANRAALGAFNSGDYRWSAHLARTVLQVNPDNETAAKLLKQSYKGVANTTTSANERNYMLTKIAELDGTIDWDTVFVASALATRLQQSDASLLKLLEDRFRSEDALTLELGIAVTIEETGERHGLRTRNGVLIYEGLASGDYDAEMSVSHEDLAKLAVGATPWPSAIDQGVIKVLSGKREARRFTQLIEVKFD